MWNRCRAHAGASSGCRRWGPVEDPFLVDGVCNFRLKSVKNRLAAARNRAIGKASPPHKGLFAQGGYRDVTDAAVRWVRGSNEQGGSSGQRLLPAASMGPCDGQGCDIGAQYPAGGCGHAHSA